MRCDALTKKKKKKRETHRERGREGDRASSRIAALFAYRMHRALYLFEPDKLNSGPFNLVSQRALAPR